MDLRVADRRRRHELERLDGNRDRERAAKRGDWLEGVLVVTGIPLVVALGGLIGYAFEQLT